MDPFPDGLPEIAVARRRRGPTLTPRRLEIIALLAQGITTGTIARRLEIAPRTVGNYRAGIYILTGTDNLPALTLYALRLGLIDADGRPVPPGTRPDTPDT